MVRGTKPPVSCGKLKVWRADFQAHKNLGAANWVGAIIRSTEGSFMQLPVLYQCPAWQIQGGNQALFRQFRQSRNNGRLYAALFRIYPK